MTKEQKLNLYNQAKEAYYNGEPIMTDIEFDELEKELGLENKSYIGTRHNPSYTEKHPVLMGSLSKVQVKEDENGKVDWKEIYQKVTGFVKPGQIIIETPKYDGCSFEAIIENGETLSISSRGDGEYGKNLYDHLVGLVNSSIRKFISERTILRGEVLIKKDIFEKKYSKDFVNPRSFVAGVLGNDYSEELEEKLNDLSIIIYDYKTIDENGNVIEHDWADLIGTIVNWCLPEFYFVEVLENENIKTIESIYWMFNEYRKNCPFALDGIVIKPIASKRDNDYTERRPKDCVAVKFIPMLQETLVKEIKWNIGKTGEMIPVVIVEPVEMDGKMITKCSGHNYGYLIENKVSIGTKVILSLAGDIIPFLYKITDTSAYDEEKLCIPDNCMTQIDGCHLMAILDEEEITKQKFLNSVTSLNIPSIGPAGAKAIFEYLGQSDEMTNEFFGEDTKELPNNILLVSPEDIWMGLGCGKMGENGKKAFEKILRNITLVDIIKSCNFKLCGSKAAIQIEKYLTNQEYDFAHLPGVSYEWVIDKNNEKFDLLKHIVEHLGKTFEDFEATATEAASLESEKIPVILTGEPTQYGTKSNFLKAHPEYRMTGSWKEVKIVFTNSLESNTGKMKKAREKGIEIRLY